jgi:hypothetical protein
MYTLRHCDVHGIQLDAVGVVHLTQQQQQQTVIHNLARLLLLACPARSAIAAAAVGVSSLPATNELPSAGAAAVSLAAAAAAELSLFAE